MVNLSNEINHPYDITKSFIISMFNIIPIIKKNGYYTTHVIEPVFGEKYKHSFDQLLLNHLKVPDSTLIPINTMLNGYNSVTDYDGKQLRIKLVDVNSSGLVNYINQFTLEKKI